MPGMEPGRGISADDYIVGATVLLALVGGWLVAAFLSVWAFYAWGARDWSSVVGIGSVTFLALAAPLILVGGYERWQTEHGVYDAVPGKATKALDGACGVFTGFFILVVIASVLLLAFFAWVFWSDGVPAASLYFAVVALTMLSGPVAFATHWERWRISNGLE
jgi:hypothetical protein